MLPNLGRTCLWEDEANTALIARNILMCGLRRASDGTNLLNLLPLPLLRCTPLEEAQWTTAGIDRRFQASANVGLSFAKGEVKALIGLPAGFPMMDYLRSLVDPPRGCIDCIVDYLHQHAAPADRVKIAYGDLPLMFHTQLAITSSTDIGPPAPQWIIPRHFNRMAVDQEFMDTFSRCRYLKIILPFPDLQWNNQPDPLYHYYRTPAASSELAPPITLWRRDESSSVSPPIH